MAASTAPPPAEPASAVSLRRGARRAPLALVGVAVVAAVALFNVVDFDRRADLRRRLRAVRKEGKRPKINLHAPYAPYRGPIEPRTPLKSDELYRRLKEGEVVEHTREIEGTVPDAAVPEAEVELLDPEEAVTDAQGRRQLSRYTISPRNGHVSCYLRATRGPRDIPEDLDMENTIIVGYPGADKRIVLRQMEAMTRLSGRDSWDFLFLGMTRQPFIKTNYPHHEGTWGWQDHGDQVALVIRNIRWSIDEYHDILADIDYAKTWVEATEKIPRLYKGEVLSDSYQRWRDERTMDEVGWYGWLIDYWMEGGILRDYFDHKLTTQAHWDKLREPETFTYGELQWDVNVCSTDNPLPGITYDPNCDPAYTADCKAKVVISAERLMDPATGHAEHRKIGLLLNETLGVKDELLGEPGWDCLYDMMITNNVNGTAPGNTEGFDDYRVREGFATRKHVVSTRHLNKMVQQLTRLINKYSALDPETGIDWSASDVAANLVDILTEHRADVQAEVDATNVNQLWAHPPKPNWVIFPMCGAAERRVWDYDYPHEYSGTVLEMFPDTA